MNTLQRKIEEGIRAKGSYRFQKEPVCIPRNNTFSLIGYIKTISIQTERTKLNVKVVNYSTTVNPNSMEFEVTFFGEAKAFIDRNARVDYVIDVKGILDYYVGKIMLVGRHSYLFAGLKGMGEEPTPFKVDPTKIDKGDLAY